MVAIPGRYQNFEIISDTTSNIVYKCEDSSNGSKVALKVFCSTDQELRLANDFQHELLQKVTHPNIIKALNRGHTQEGFPFLVMELANDGNLRDKTNSIDLLDKQRVALQIAEALDFLHSIGYVHGDIKPSNILLFRDDDAGIKIKLSDFEFLKPGGQISTNTWQGTPAYMAPEMIRGEPIGYYSDLYSLGILMFELLCSRHPYHQENLYRLAYDQLDQEPDFDVNEKTYLSPRLVSIVQSLLFKNPVERTQSAWKVRDLLLDDVSRKRQADIILGHALVEFLCESKLNQGFQPQELKSLLVHTFNCAGSEERLSQYLLDKSGANPSIIGQYLCEMISRDIITRTNGYWKISESLDSFTLSPKLVIQHLPGATSSLCSKELEVLEVISIFKYPVELATLKKMLNLESSLLAENLCKLINIGWLVDENESQLNRIRFIKGIDRDFILQGIDNESLSEIRRNAIQVLQERLLQDYREDSLKELLYQAEEIADSPRIYWYALLLSNLSIDRNLKSEAQYYTLLALKHGRQDSDEKNNLLRRVADFYDEKGQPREAVKYYLQYLSFEPTESERTADTERKLGWNHARLANFEQAEKYLTLSFQHFKNLSNQSMQAQVLLDLSAAKHMERDYPGCDAKLKQCEELLHDWQDTEEQARLFNLRGILEWSKGNFEESHKRLQKSLCIYETLKKLKEAGRVANNLGLLLRDWDKLRESLAYLQKDLEISQKLVDQVSLCSSYNNIAILYHALRDFDEANHYADQALELARKLPHKAGEALAHNNLGSLFLSMGILDKSLLHLRESISRFKELQNLSGCSLAYFNLGEVYRVREEPALAVEAYQMSLSSRRKLGEKLGIADCLAGLSKLYLEMENFEECSKYLPESLSLYKELSKTREVALLLLSQEEAFCRSKRSQEAEYVIRQVSESMSEIKDVLVESNLHLVCGLLEKNKNDFDSAERNLLAALKGLRAGQDRVAQAKASLYLGELYKSSGKKRHATKFWRESLGLYHELKVRPKIGMLERLMDEVSKTGGKDLEQLQTLSKVSKLLTQLEDEEELLNEVLKLAMDLLGAERGAIILYDESRSVFEVRASCGIEQETARDALEISKRTVKEVQQTGHTFISRDASSDPSLRDHPSIRTHNILSILCAPLRVNQKVIGTLYLDNRTLTRAFSEEDHDFIETLSNLIAVAIATAYTYGKVYEENFQLRQRTGAVYDFQNIVGKSPQMQEIFNLVSKVAPSKATVIIQGEMGTGKELIANLIHNLSDRKSGPFIRVNCAAIPESLLESELFGVEEKVATGVTFREGKFKQADGGTIFLDEIGDMNLATQAKVLRVLQEKEFERVGGSKTLKVDIRVISATNKDLFELMKDKLFRADLFYRLNTVPINLPPLRERKEDIPFLIDFFLKKFCDENCRPNLKISPLVIQALCSYEWPGNVRELMNVVERGVIFAEKGEFAYDQLPVQFSNELTGPSRPRSAGKLRQSLAKFEKQLISGALEQTNWHQAKAAKILGIPEPTLIRKIKLHKIRKPKIF